MDLLRITDHIRQCLRNMKPTMGYEIAAKNEIEADLKKIEAFSPSQHSVADERTARGAMDES